MIHLECFRFCMKEPFLKAQVMKYSTTDILSIHHRLIIGYGRDRYTPGKSTYMYLQTWGLWADVVEQWLRSHLLSVMWPCFRNHCFRFIELKSVLFLNGPNAASFVYLNSFHKTNKAHKFDKTIDGVPGTRTRAGRMVGKDEFTELWRQLCVPTMFVTVLCLKRN